MQRKHWPAEQILIRLSEEGDGFITSKRVGSFCFEQRFVSAVRHSADDSETAPAAKLGFFRRVLARLFPSSAPADAQTGFTSLSLSAVPLRPEPYRYS